jgi:hypothetical protein
LLRFYRLADHRAWPNSFIRNDGSADAHKSCRLRDDKNLGRVLKKLSRTGEQNMAHLDPWLALGVSVSTAVTDAVYVMFNAAVSARKRLPAATWSSVWYLLSAFAVISYTRNWVYVGFAAAGSWVGAYASLTLLHGAEKARAVRPF